jgi:carboxyl-terminal processing protease
MQDFSETTDEELGVALETLKKAGMQRLVLDIRDNPGGPLIRRLPSPAGSQSGADGGLHAVACGDLLRTIASKNRGGYLDVPMVIMTNRNSASASEIVSGAMQDTARCWSARRRSARRWCRASIASPRGAGLALTTGRYFTPSDRMIQRPWDGAFDEYLTYTYREQKATTRTKRAPAQPTAGGRYTRRRIEPDHFIQDRSKGSARHGSRGCCAIAARSSPLPSDSRRTATAGSRKSAAAAASGPRLAGVRRHARGIPRFRRSASASFDEAAYKADAASSRR